MSTRDAIFSYIHLEDSNQVLYMEKWQDDVIPYDDIDTQTLFEETTNMFPHFLLEEEEEGEIPLNSSTFGAKVHKNRKLLKHKAWTDLSVFDKFMDESSSLHKQTDKTILKPVKTGGGGSGTQLGGDRDQYEFLMSDFLANGYGASERLDNILSEDLVNDSIMGTNSGDVSNVSASELLPPTHGNFSLNVRTASGNNGHYPTNVIQTPRGSRSRQPSNDRIFQTPVTRIMR